MPDSVKRLLEVYEVEEQIALVSGILGASLLYRDLLPYPRPCTRNDALSIFTFSIFTVYVRMEAPLA